jgi:hypothetical protein
MTGVAWPPVEVYRDDPVDLTGLDEVATLVWGALLSLDETLAAPWCLVGGQAVVLHCLERGVTPVRATDDGDVVVDVFASRGALSAATSVLDDLGFAQRTDNGGYGYRWVNGAAHIDVLVPERANAQRRPALTRRGARSVETPAAQQAIARAERVPVLLPFRSGRVPRPDLLGTIVVKAAAAVADTRDPERHLQDIAVLCSLAPGPDLVRMLDRVTPKDRRRLRRVAPRLAPGASAWRHARDPVAAADVFGLLLEDS